MCEDQGNIIKWKNEKVAIAPSEKGTEVVLRRLNGNGRGDIDAEMKTTMELGRRTGIAMNIGAHAGNTSHPDEIAKRKIRHTPDGGMTGHIQGLPVVLRAGTELAIATTIEDGTVNPHISPARVPAHGITNLGDRSRKMRYHMALTVLASIPARAITACHRLLLQLHIQMGRITSPIP
jgi:hypothetical protein